MDDVAAQPEGAGDDSLEAAKCMFHILYANARWDLLPVDDPKKIRLGLMDLLSLTT